MKEGRKEGRKVIAAVTFSFHINVDFKGTSASNYLVPKVQSPAVIKSLSLNDIASLSTVGHKVA